MRIFAVEKSAYSLIVAQRIEKCRKTSHKAPGSIGELSKLRFEKHNR